MLTLTLLGTGSSTGVPVIGCNCDVCTSSHPRNQRMRASALFRSGDIHILIDSSPDFRLQALRANIRRLDAVIYTHAHADHLHGIEDLRMIHFITQHAPIHAYGLPSTLHELTQRFGYTVITPDPSTSYRQPYMMLHPLPMSEQYDIHQSSDGLPSVYTTKIAGLDVTFFIQDHGHMPVLGVRIGNIAYSTDIVRLPPWAIEILRDIDIWVVDCLRHAASPTHAHTDLVMEWVQLIRPKRTILTHMSHEMDYAQLAKQCPAGIEPGYDGMIIDSEFITCHD